MPLAFAMAALAAAVLPVPAATVERLYSAGLYRALQPRLTFLSNQVPFSLLDAALVVVVALWAALVARDVMRLHSAWRATRRAAVRTITWAAAAYLVFVIVWGFNYRRVRLVDALPFDATRVNGAAVRNAAAVAVERLNGLHEPAHAAAGNATADPSLTEAIQRALADVGRSHPLTIGRPKRTILDPYFRRAGVDGMTDPFFLETLISTDVLPFERPFVIAHEWAHLAGVADEGEANFVGWLASQRASPAAQYSGWLFLYRELTQSIPAEARASVAAALGPGPRADLLAIRERVLAHVDPRVAAVGWSVYDSYLKANRVEAGAASYGDVVPLVLGARLASGREPLVH